jgi:serine/threonine protein kinase
MKYKINPIYEKTFTDFLLNIRKYFNQNQNSIHKARNELKIISYNDVETVVKSFKVPNLLRRIYYTFFRDTKAKKSYDNSIKIGNFTPIPIGYIEFYTQGLLADSYFVAKKFNYDFTIKEPIVNTQLVDRINIFHEFAKFTFELHEHNIYHNDYSPGNILIKREETGYTFKIVDINRMKFTELSLDERLKNFAKLWLLDEDLITIIREYAELIHEDKEKCVNIALKHSHALKRKINMKKRLKGIEVVD